MLKTATTVTAEDLIKRYAADLGYVAEAEAPAATLDMLAHYADTAATNFDMAGINGHEDIDTASQCLNEAHLATDATERDVFLRKADQLLRPIMSDMTQEYRTMVDD